MKNISYQKIARRIKLLAHPERLQILNALRREAECVCHLEALLDKPQPYISKQLALLRRAKIIADEKEGLNVYYRLVDVEIRAWLDEILGPVKNDDPLSSERNPQCPCPKCDVEEVILAI